MNDEESHQILVEWNRTARDYPRDKCIHQLFEEQAERRWDAVALVCEEQSFTYGELNLCSNQLARHLRLLGVGPDVLVGLCAERSLEMVVALLGILKAGGAYVPLDPTLPKKRLEFILRDTNPAVVLVLQRLRDRLPATTDLAINPPHVLVLEELLERVSQSNDANLPSLNTSNHLAYVTYTSGTTGRPKGVMVPHLGIVRLVISPNYVSLTPCDVMLQFAPLAFDASTFEIWGCLLNGAKLVVCPPRQLDCAELGQLIQEHSITTLWLTAALFHEMMEQVPQTLAQVRQLLAGGDVLSPSKVRRYLGLPVHGRLINGYGPTENTTFTCCAAFDRPEEIGGGVPIGRPISGTEVYILNPQGEMVQIGLPGELCIGGDGLARGYLSAPQITLEKFVPNPFSRETGARMYRSGDLARWLPNGNIEFLGRRDDQIKIRGYRVELGEIEAVLAEHSGVSACAVVARDHGGCEKRILAYYVSKEGTRVSAKALTDYLQQHLPNYMVPARFAELPSLPLAPNGKVDRNALDNLNEVKLSSRIQYIAPRNQLERELTAIWKKVLKLERVGVQDNFFDLGGHSLQAMRIKALIFEQLSLQLPLPWLFEEGTIEKLVHRITSERIQKQTFSRMEKVIGGQPKSMSFGQQRMWLMQQTLPDPATYNVAIHYQFREKLDPNLVRKCIQGIAARHEILRTSLVQVGEDLIQRVIDPASALVPWRVEVMMNASAASLSQRIREVSRNAFELANGPLLHATWIITSEKEAALILNFHHSIVDEWSLRLFQSELEQLYVANGETGKAGLPSLPIQYADFSIWQRQRIQSGVIENQRIYWREQLRDLPPPLELPSDYARPARWSGQGSVHRFRLCDREVAVLRELARSEGTTLFVLLLAVFKVWLYRHTGLTDLVVGTPLSNRDHLDSHLLIGFFLNTVPIRTQLEGQISFREFLGRVRRSVLSGFEHGDLPFEQIVEMAAQNRVKRHHPICGLILVVLEDKLPDLVLGGAHGRAHLVNTATSKFDFTLTVHTRAHQWNAEIEYASDLFSAETVARMAAHLSVLLHSITREPDKPIRELGLMHAREVDPKALEQSHRFDPTPSESLRCEREAEAPIDLLEVRLVQIWEELLGVKPIGLRDNFFALGGHSLLAARLFARIENHLGIRLPLATLFQAPTIEGIGAALRSAGWLPPWKSLVALKTGGKLQPIFLVHGVGGNLVGFHALANNLDDDRPIYGLQSPGLDGRTPTPKSIEKMAELYIKEVLSVRPTGPYHLAGLSFGGVVAYEMAQQLTAMGHQVGLVALLDSFPLGESELVPLTRRTLKEIGLWKRRAAGHWRDLRALRTGDWPDYVGRKYRTLLRRARSRVWQMAFRLYGTRDDGLPKVFNNVRESNYFASRNYVTKPYPGKVTVFMADDHMPSNRRLLRTVWGRVALGGAEFHEVPGDHVTLIEEPHVKVLADKLRGCLAAFRQESRT